MTTCLVALGSNLGESRQILQRAIEALDAFPNIDVVRRSRWCETDPIGGPEGQSPFLNGAVRLETSLPAEQLHARLREVESRLGRQRRERWAARHIDLDLLLFGELVLHSDDLTIPHPRMAFRRFVLEPAAEVAGDLRHPLIGWTVQQLLDHLNRAVGYVALTGPPGAGKTELARRTVRATGARLIEDPAAALLPPVLEAAADREVAILSQRVAAVDRESWRDDRAGAVSDFWIGQSMAYAAVAGSEFLAEPLEDRWRRLSPCAVSPKLLVWLDAPADETRAERAAPDAAPSAGGCGRQAVPDRAIWEDVVRRCHRGPWLQLDASRPDWALTEITAAVQAMR